MGKVVKELWHPSWQRIIRRFLFISFVALQLWYCRSNCGAIFCYIQTTYSEFYFAEILLEAEQWNDGLLATIRERVLLACALEAFGYLSCDCFNFFSVSYAFLFK